MNQYAHTSDAKPFFLKKTWQHPITKQDHMGMEVRSPENLAALGLYPVRREPLEPGAAGYGEIALIGDEFVIPSLPGDPQAVQQAYLDNLSCTRLQGRLELIAQGLWLTVQEWAASAGEAEIAYFEDAQTWRFRDATLQAAATGMGLTEAQVIGMFESAQQR